MIYLNKLNFKRGKNMKRIITFSVIAMAMIFAVIGIIKEQKSVATLDLSDGMNIIANGQQMSKSAMVNNKIVFSADDFEKNMNLSEINSITVTSLPPMTDGCLCVADVAVNVGQTISTQNLNLLNYRPANENVTHTTFKFKVNENEYEMTCNLYFLTRENSAPTLLMEDERTFAVSTHQSVRVYGKVLAYDEDGDKLRYEIVTYAKNGVLDFDGSSGEYSYTPTGEYFGEDYFEYVAIDEYGNYSGSQKVSLEVKKRQTDVNFCDMQNHRDHTAVLTMTEMGVMSGTKIGSEIYFMPDKAVSRVDFVAMLLNAIGQKEVETVLDTGFDDDDEIPSSMKGYVKKAREMGLIDGSVNTNGDYLFEPNREITRAEAALVVSRLVNGSVPTVKPTFSDKNEIPAWAHDAIYTLNHLGILQSENGAIAASSPLTRSQTAQMLCVLIGYIN